MKENVDTTSFFDVETTLIQPCSTLLQELLKLVSTLFQHPCKLSQRCFSMAATLVKPMSKPIRRVISMDLQANTF